MSCFNMKVQTTCSRLSGLAGRRLERPRSLTTSLRSVAQVASVIFHALLCERIQKGTPQQSCFDLSLLVSTATCLPPLPHGAGTFVSSGVLGPQAHRVRESSCCIHMVKRVLHHVRSPLSRRHQRQVRQQGDTGAKWCMHMCVLMRVFPHVSTWLPAPSMRTAMPSLCHLGCCISRFVPTSIPRCVDGLADAAHIRHQTLSYWRHTFLCKGLARKTVGRSGLLMHREPCQLMHWCVVAVNATEVRNALY